MSKALKRKQGDTPNTKPKKIPKRTIEKTKDEITEEAKSLKLGHIGGDYYDDSRMKNRSVQEMISRIKNLYDRKSEKKERAILIDDISRLLKWVLKTSGMSMDQLIYFALVELGIKVDDFDPTISDCEDECEDESEKDDGRREEVNSNISVRAEK